MKLSRGEKIYVALLHVIMILAGLICLLPVLNVFARSLSSVPAVAGGKVWFWPVEFNPEGWKYVLQRTMKDIQTLRDNPDFANSEEGMALLLKWMGVSNIINRIIVLVFVMAFNYVVSKFWVFKAKPGESTQAPAGTASAPADTARHKS